MLLKLSDVMRNAGLDPKMVKLARHPLSDKRIKFCYDNGFFELYLRTQGKKMFKDGQYILNFVGTQGTTGRFEGCYLVKGVRSMEGITLPESFPIKPEKPPVFYYDLEKTDIMSDYVERLLIDWGKGARNWCHNGTTEKEIVALMPHRNAQLVSKLTDFENMRLSFDELESIIAAPDFYSDWVGALSTTYAIYLITDTVSGKQYVGSAYGKNGLYGRWSEYVNTRHGGNKKIKELLKEDSERYHKFQFSILQILPKSLAVDNTSVIEIESLWKSKLNTIKFGLNDN
ncbi:GIY-YIG nuclease family protein [Agathobaculum sp.]|uniref:GIY-YIG nuclease family protein n=1 Tax=Agathobaculum sp. TaxID=2048138 RepID=UPI0035214B19